MSLLERWVKLYEELRDDTEGQLPEPDVGCIECTQGTVPNNLNTGLCVYHETKHAIKRVEELLK